MKKILAAITLVVGAGLLYAVFQFFDVHEFTLLIKQIPGILLLAYLVVSVSIILAIVLRWKLICRQQQLDISFWHLLAYRYAGFAVSFITPGPRVGGEPVRAGLMTRHNIKVSEAMSSVVADKTNELLSFAVMFVIALTTATFTLDLPRSLYSFFIITNLVLLGLVAFSLYHILRGKDPVLKLYKVFKLYKIAWIKKHEKTITEFEENIHGYYTDNPRYFWISFLISCVAWSLSIVEFSLILYMLGIQPTILTAFLVYTVVGIVYLIPVPFALGTLEAGQASLFSGLGMPAAAGAVLAMITRSRDLLWTLIGLCVLAYYSTKNYEPETTSDISN